MIHTARPCRSHRDDPPPLRWLNIILLSRATRMSNVTFLAPVHVYSATKRRAVYDPIAGDGEVQESLSLSLSRAHECSLYAHPGSILERNVLSRKAPRRHHPRNGHGRAWVGCSGFSTFESFSNRAQQLVAVASAAVCGRVTG